MHWGLMLFSVLIGFLGYQVWKAAPWWGRLLLIVGWIAYALLCGVLGALGVL